MSGKIDFTIKFCDQCGDYSYNLRDPLNIVDASPSTDITIFEKAPSLLKEEVIEAIRKSAATNLKQGSTKVRFDKNSRKIEIVGPISNYEHDCKEKDFQSAFKKILNEERQKLSSKQSDNTQCDNTIKYAAIAIAAFAIAEFVQYYSK